ncbi:MAG: class I SAM-dependent methyltransferase [Alphaproteobacteria bacterium]|nr:class I SAM-dependent methyltransferase [Alphaproteobacteria bacterium]
MILDRVIKALIHRGDLTVTDWKGVTKRYGDGGLPKSHIRFHSVAAALKVALDPDLHLGEVVTDGTLSIEQGSIRDFLGLLMQNVGSGQTNHPLHRLAYRARLALRRVHQYNPVGKAERNITHHYDINGEIYDLFLDRDRQYSCAYFENEDATLEEAQLAKKRHIAAKLGIKPGMKVLDIGSGWGGMGIYLAQVCGAEVTGVTLSHEQHDLSNRRVAEKGLSDRVQFLLQDYRKLDQTFDRIVSVGMFEHVGLGHYKEFFTKVSGLLAADGNALLHSINRADGPGITGAWIKKYIFPGGYIPALSEVIPHMERAKLYITDIEILRMHYARTLAEWGRRFTANHARAKEIYDERFCRMWDFYLAGSECSFLYAEMNNFQIQFAKHQHVMPFTRSYVEQEEARLRQLEKSAKL